MTAATTIPFTAGRASAQPKPIDWIEAFGSPALSPLALAEGKEHFWSAGNRCLIAYRRESSLALALGEPLGPADTSSGATAEFLAFCRDRRLSPAFVPIGAEQAASMESSGLRTLHVGEEARLDLRSFHLAGTPRKSLRQSANKAARGLRVRLSFPPHDPDPIDALATVSRSWLATKRAPENRFGMGWFDPADLRRRPLAIAVSTRGTEAFLTFFGRDKTLGVDLMRQRADAPPGTMDYLYVESIRVLAARGWESLSLGLAPFSGASFDHQRGVFAAVARWLGRRDAWYSCRGLRRFKEKFRPEWRPCYLAYASPTMLPRIFMTATGLGWPSTLPALLS